MCGFTSTAYDPFLDVSLDLYPMLEAAKHHNGAHLPDMRACSRTNTAGVAAAASGPGGGHASLLSGQPSLTSLPSGSLPSLSGTTDAFSVAAPHERPSAAAAKQQQPSCLEDRSSLGPEVRG